MKLYPSTGVAIAVTILFLLIVIFTSGCTTNYRLSPPYTTTVNSTTAEIQPRFTSYEHIRQAQVYNEILSK